MATAASRGIARFATDAERSGWNALVAANPDGGEVWGGAEYLDIKEREGGYRQYRVIVERPELPPLAIGVLAKRVPMLGEWWHLPAGPPGESAASVLATVDVLADFARSRGVFLLKVEPRVSLADAELFHTAGFRDTVRIIPNPSTILVDVSGTEAEILARIGKKARNSINRAKRDGIVVTRVSASDAHCDELFGLLQETAEGRFVLRSSTYYRSFWQSFSQAGVGQIFLAHREGALVAGAFAMALGDKTTYKDGASVRAKTAYGASHAVQWEVLRWAGERGATTHDLCGAPPAAQVDDRSHPLHGVGQFKRSFASEIIDYAGAFDVPLKPWAYAFWVRLGDRLARRWSLMVRKDPYY